MNRTEKIAAILFITGILVVMLFGMHIQDHGGLNMFQIIKAVF